jgi:triphosphoribosyl-dephospho-CoA synthase
MGACSNAVAVRTPLREPVAGSCGASADANANVPLSDAQLARLAVEALIEEAQLTPKPALVDRRGSGAHRDLDLAKMIRSAQTLEATFVALARASRRRTPSATLRAELAQIGRAGEADMMQATDGSNAHRGAIWILGLLVAGAAICDTSAPASADATGRSITLADASSRGKVRDAMTRRVRAPRDTAALAARICETGARIACFPDRFADSTGSHGERVRQRYRVGGARHEAQDGFPHVIAIGLPALHAARANGVRENDARVDTLLAIMASLDDTCLLHRAGLPGLHAGQHGAQRVLANGGSSTPAGRAALASLERELMSLNASPGGAADLLAATLFIDSLVRQRTSGSAATWNI